MPSANSVHPCTKLGYLALTLSTLSLCTCDGLLRPRKTEDNSLGDAGKDFWRAEIAAKVESGAEYLETGAFLDVPAKTSDGAKVVFKTIQMPGRADYFYSLGSATVTSTVSSAVAIPAHAPSGTGVYFDNIFPRHFPKLDWDFDVVNWMGLDPQYEEGWAYSRGYWPRYYVQPEKNSPDSEMESIWPLGSVLSVKYLNDLDEGVPRRIKYLAAVVTAGAISIGGSGSAMGSTANERDQSDLRFAYLPSKPSAAPASDYILCKGDLTHKRHKIGVATYVSGHVLGDRQGGVANYWNLFPQHDIVNGGTFFTKNPAGTDWNPWSAFEKWLYDEVRNAATINKAPGNYPAVYVFFKFVYYDASWFSTDDTQQQVRDRAPRIIMFYAASKAKMGVDPRVQEAKKIGYVTNFPNDCSYIPKGRDLVDSIRSMMSRIANATGSAVSF